jgi:hypothetical protein
MERTVVVAWRRAIMLAEMLSGSIIFRQLEVQWS